LSRKLKIAMGIIPIVLVIDRITKVWAESALGNGTRMELLGGLLPLTLAYNKGAAFGMSIGEDSRWFFIPVTFVALGLMAVLYRQAEARDWLRHTALALVVSGALGNLYDRIFIAEGVVDFFGPVDLGFYNFPIFNVADIAITCGAILLAVSFWQEEKAERRAAAALEESPDPGR
jgi:signal peptidase II